MSWIDAASSSMRTMTGKIGWWQCICGMWLDQAVWKDQFITITVVGVYFPKQGNKLTRLTGGVEFVWLLAETPSSGPIWVCSYSEYSLDIASSSSDILLTGPTLK